MRVSFALLGFAAVVLAQGVTQLIVPSSTPPAGCENSRQGAFTITITNVTTNATTPSPTRRSRNFIRGRDVGSLYPRQQDGVLTLRLTGGVLVDQANRTGYIASNYQFQFDGPPQAGAIYTAGWGICANGSLSLGGQAVFWSCLSGSYYNLYDRQWAQLCFPVYLEAIEGAGQAYSTAPPGPESTGPSENTIANGGGTQSANSTFTFGAATSSASSGSSIASTSATMTSASGSQSASQSASESASASSSPSSLSAAGAVMPTSVPQQVIAWAVGIIGAVAMI